MTAPVDPDPTLALLQHLGFARTPEQVERYRAKLAEHAGRDAQYWADLRARLGLPARTVQS